MADVKEDMQTFQENLNHTRKQLATDIPTKMMQVSLIVENLSSYDLTYKDAYLQLFFNGEAEKRYQMMSSEHQLPSESAGGLFLIGGKYQNFLYIK